MKNLQIKTIGFICLETDKVQTKKGKVKRFVRVLSHKIYKTKKAMLEAKKQMIESRFIQNSLNTIGHALNIENLRNDVLAYYQNTKKSYRWYNLHGYISKSVAFARLYGAKMRLFKYINSLDRYTKLAVNDLLDYSALFNFNLRALNLA